MDQSELIIDLVIELAVEIGREGRVGHPVGTMFVVGDAPTVCRFSSGCDVDPFFGYGPNDRDLFDPRVREDVKEIARLDGAFIIDNRGLIERSRQLIEFSHEELMITITTTRVWVPGTGWARRSHVNPTLRPLWLVNRPDRFVFIEKEAW